MGTEPLQFGEVDLHFHFVWLVVKTSSTGLSLIQKPPIELKSIVNLK